MKYPHKLAHAYKEKILSYTVNKSKIKTLRKEQYLIFCYFSKNLKNLKKTQSWAERNI